MLAGEAELQRLAKEIANKDGTPPLITSADRSAYLMKISGYSALEQILDLSALDEAVEHLTLTETFAPY